MIRIRDARLREGPVAFAGAEQSGASQLPDAFADLQNATVKRPVAKGLGTGRIALTIDAQGTPTGYRWSTETYSKPRATTVAVAHLE